MIRSSSGCQVDSSSQYSLVVLFGGSFDPPHLGHLEIIKRLDSSYKRVIVIPTFCNPFKAPPQAPIHTRIAWLKELCADYLRVEISDFEACANRVVYAIEYVRYYTSKYGEIGLALGSDALESLPRWREASELARLARIVPLMRDFEFCDTAHNVGSPQTQKLVLEKVDSRYSTTVPLHITGFPISSTQIRAALVRGEFERVARWVPPSIVPCVRKIYYNTH